MEMKRASWSECRRELDEILHPMDYRYALIDNGHYVLSELCPRYLEKTRLTESENEMV
jgi:hypothetical protein